MKALDPLFDRIRVGGTIPVTGVVPSAHSFLAVQVACSLRLPVLLVADSLRTQEKLAQDAETWLRLTAESKRGSGPYPLSEETDPPGTHPAAPKHPELLFYPEWDILPADGKLPHTDVIADRIEVLLALERIRGASAETEKSPAPPLVVTTFAALFQRTLHPEEIRRRTRQLRRGERIDPLDLIEWLEEQGFEPEARVTQKGEMASRGGILDLFPLTAPWPVRIEFFGDQIESIREFDPDTQRSLNCIEATLVPPASELGLLRRPSQPAAGAALLNYLPPHTILMVSEPDRCRERLESYLRQVPKNDPFNLAPMAAAADLAKQTQARIWLSEFPCCKVPPTIGGAAQLKSDTELGAEVFGSRIDSTDSPGDTLIPPATTSADCGVLFAEMEESEPALDLEITSLETFRAIVDRPSDGSLAETQRREFFAQIHRWHRLGYDVQLFCNAPGELQRFWEIWNEYGLAAAPNQSAAVDLDLESSVGKNRVASGLSKDSANSLKTESAGPVLRREPFIGPLSGGFLYEAARLAVITDAEIFGRYRVVSPRRLKAKHASAVRSALEIDFADLQPGDYVVHLSHGIGRYVGLNAIAETPPSSQPSSMSPPGAGLGTESLVIEYAAAEEGQTPPKLYVPVSEAHLVSKYIGAGKANPPLNTLGGARWMRAKQQAENAVRDLAAELLRIQAARETSPGKACSADTSWQIEFESAFPFEETPDQQRAIDATKRDLELPRAMDRLICGDVGFGKTEVAIRAAFKVVMGGAQVAVLVPTTVLAQQHFNTFRERLADYPIRVELLSRFRTRREQDSVVQSLAAGAVDIVIGTHRLVQEDVDFKNLGLVVIDEEQRFGVLQKERFKKLRQTVDVLTLSATPIPRTLYLALAGARDLSTIQTPPADRLQVETIVSQYDERVIRDAIQRELNRAGQVFFLHNRVGTIDQMAAKLKMLVPDARILIGHGQMPSDTLEEVMTRFVAGEADVLLSTTIIESGLDIPNANTIIIDRADRFGLSDLYQLRGRVGRYKHQAYAYLLLPRHAGLVADARRRIGALRQFSALGSGFQIAMRDLEIRGAGNMLGSEQSGHITAVGFELYCQLLKQSVASLKGEKVRPRIDVLLRLDFIALNSPGNADAAGAASESGQADFESSARRKASGARSPRTDPASGGKRGARASRGSGQEARQSVGEPQMAGIPARYIPDLRQRLEIYRKLAQLAAPADLRLLRDELQDRFGLPPVPVDYLLELGRLKILAASKGVTLIETREDRLMMTRHGELVMRHGMFPRLHKRGAKARLAEVFKQLEGVV